jgi:hypothetical protein
VNEVTAQALTADDVIADEAASFWLKSALQTALERDPVDALNDAIVLAATLEMRLRFVLDLDSSD